jgi:hypothetical protein
MLFTPSALCPGGPFYTIRPTYSKLSLPFELSCQHLVSISDYTTRATGRAHLILYDVIILTIVGEKYNSWSSYYPRLPVTTRMCENTKLVAAFLADMFQLKVKYYKNTSTVNCNTEMQVHVFRENCRFSNGSRPPMFENLAEKTGGSLQ